LGAAPAVTVTSCKTAPKVDGRLDDACWRGITPLTGFTLAGKGERAALQTTARIIHDSEWLYLGIVCQHPSPKQMKCSVHEHDGSVSRDESVEVFLDPGTDGNLYFHFMVNSANTRAEQRAGSGGSRDRGWNPRWLSATRPTTTGWSVEIAIPLYLVTSEGSPARARMNIARNTPPEASAWAPVGSNFHDPSSFGVLKGLDGVRAEIPFLAFGKVRIRPYYRARGQHHYDVTLDIGGDRDRDRKVTIKVADEPAFGRGQAVKRTFEVPAAKQVSVTVPVPVARLASRNVVVTMMDAGAGHTLQTVTVSSPPALDAMSVCLDRSYYTTERNAQVHCWPTTQMLRSRAVVVRDANGKILGRTEDISAETVVPLDIESMPTGKHSLTVELLRQNGELAFTHEPVLVKREPKPGREWKVDRLNRILLRDGKPFFPFGFVMFMWRRSQIQDDRYFAQAADIGMNTALQWCKRMEPEDGATYLKMAAKHDLTVLGLAMAFFKGQPMPHADEYLDKETAAHLRKLAKKIDPNRMKVALMYDPILRKLSPEQKIRVFDEYFDGNATRLRRAIRLMKDDPRLIGYKLFDEPPEKKYFPMYEGCRRLSRELDEADGYHPTFTLYSSYIPDGDEYVDFTDCLGTDPYWVPGNRRRDLRGTVNFVSRITALTDARAAERRQVTWIVLLAEYRIAGSKRPLTPQEQACQTYLALIHGAKALFYFQHPVCSRVTVEGFRRLARQMDLLGPIAMTPAVPQEIQYEPGKFLPQANNPATYPDVQVSLRRNPAGGYVLLAANTRYHPVDVTCGISLLGKDGAVRRLFAEGTYPVSDGAFCERLAGMETRAYAFDAPEPEALPASISVHMQAYPELITPEVAVPTQGRVGKGNLIPNPSFEENTLPGWPDYFTCSTPGIGLDYFLNDPNARYALDPTCPMHGKYAVKMVSTQRGGTWTMCEVHPKEAVPTEYVFSAYVKADREGMKAGWMAFDYFPIGKKPYPKFALTTEWKRYYVTGTVPVPSQFGNPIWGVRTDDIGTIWVDGLQLEKGSVPTKFEP